MKRSTLLLHPHKPLTKSVLFPYQRKWVRDQSRFKIGLWARQTGKDFSCGAEAVLDCMRRPGTRWIILAAGERQALESLAKAKEWARLNAYAIHSYTERRMGEALLKSAEIIWQNGSRISALPARPETVRGFSANLILTEFAFHEKSEEIWRAIYPTISNPLRGGEKKLRIVSTPNGKANMFYKLWHQAADYSRHKITIHDAVAQGLPLRIDELRAGIDDPQGWLQEYECEFIDDASVLLPYELIAQCEHDDATVISESAPPRDQTFIGIDFGRKRDLTVAWTLLLKDGALWTTEVLVLEGMSTPDQVEQLRPRLAIARRVAIDYTGPGIGLGDFLAREFGQMNPDGSGGKIELCNFTQPLKSELFSKLRLAFEQKRVRIPSQRAIREDLHAMQRVTSANGTISYRATGTPDGHCDRATALALALRAAGEQRDIAHHWQAVPSARRDPTGSFARYRRWRRRVQATRRALTI